MSLSGYYFDHIGLKNCYFFPSLCRRRWSHSICLLANFSIIWSSSQQVNIIKNRFIVFGSLRSCASPSCLIFNPSNDRMLAGHEKSYKSLLSVYQSSWSSGSRRGREVKQQRKMFSSCFTTYSTCKQRTFKRYKFLVHRGLICCTIVQLHGI